MDAGMLVAVCSLIAVVLASAAVVVRSNNRAVSDMVAIHARLMERLAAIDYARPYHILERDESGNPHVLDRIDRGEVPMNRTTTLNQRIQNQVPLVAPPQGPLDPLADSGDYQQVETTSR